MALHTMQPSEYPKAQGADGYDLVSRINHWVLALLLLAMIGVGFFLSWVELPREERTPILALHKATGVVLLLLCAWRVVWRAKRGFPDPVDDSPPWQHRVARVTHLLLLVCTVLMPLSGMVGSLWGGRDIDVFGLFTLPTMGDIALVDDIADGTHTVTAYVLTGLLLAHIGAALKHHFLNHDMTLKRMLVGPGAQSAAGPNPNGLGQGPEPGPPGIETDTHERMKPCADENS